MSHIAKCKVTYPYFIIHLRTGQNPQNIGKNLDKLYLYIDKYKNMGSLFTYGNAYKAIRIRANQLRRHYNWKISKRQIKSLIKYFGTSSPYIKIPYYSYYIFKAIFEIVDELNTQYPINQNDDLKDFVNKTRRDIFYFEQSNLFRQWFNNRHNQHTSLTVALYNDLFAPNSILSQKF